MKLHILGRYGPYPAPGGACSGYLLEQGETRLVVDCGSGTFSRLLQKTDFDSVGAAFLSHLHADHMADLLIMRYAKDIRKKPLVIYAPASPADMYGLLERDALFDLRPVSDGMRVRFGEIDVAFCEMTHPVESYAMRFSCGGETLVFSGDTNYNERLGPFAKGASLFLCDAALLEWDRAPGKVYPHLSAREAGRIAAEAGVGRLALTHLRAAHAPEEYVAEAKAEFLGAFAVEEGKTYTVRG